MDTLRARNSHGAYLIETLVAMLLGALLCFVLLQMLGETMRVTSTNANQQNAATFAQTVLDSVKTLRYEDLVVGTYPLLVNSTTAGEVAPAGHPLPVGLNVGTLKWSDKSTGNKFPGTVTLTVQQGLDGVTKDAVVTVKWSDSQMKAGKTVATMTKLHPRGTNFWP